MAKRFIDAEELELEYYGLSIHGTIAVKSVLPIFADLLDKQPTADVVETKRISEILAVLFENNIVEKYIPNTANAGSWEDFLRKACSREYGMLR